MSERRVPVEPIAPCEYLKDYLEGRGWTQDDLAEVTGRSRAHINRLVGGKTAVTPETAHELAQAFGTSAELWMNLQTSYELAKVAKRDRDIEKRGLIYTRFPIREMVKRCWIDSSDSLDTLEERICTFMRIERVDEGMPTELVARKSTEYGTDTPAQIAWFRRAQYLASAVGAAEYDENRIDECISSLRSLAANPEDVRQVPSVLAKYGIRLLFVETIAKAKIEGIAFWLGSNAPAIALSLRYDRIDNFWHNLLHEIVHIKYRDEPVVDIELDCEAGAVIPASENRANSEACHYLIDREKMESFILRNDPLYYQEKIVQFANARGIHPGIVAGQLHGRGKLDFKYHRKLLVPIRSLILGQALTDGWGNSPAV